MSDFLFMIHSMLIYGFICVYGTCAICMYVCHVLCVKVRRSSLCHSLPSLQGLSFFRHHTACQEAGPRSSSNQFISAPISVVGTLRFQKPCCVFKGLENLNSGSRASMALVSYPLSYFPGSYSVAFKVEILYTLRQFSSRKQKGRSAV